MLKKFKIAFFKQYVAFMEEKLKVVAEKTEIPYEDLKKRYLQTMEDFIAVDN